MAGKRFLINAGPTREFLDPVRFISNPSSGKMGFAIAEEASRRGAKVTLIAGPVTLKTPDGVHRTDVTSSEEMFEACKKEFSQANIFIATAAVGDYRPKKTEGKKIKKSSEELQVTFVPNIDILLTLGREKRQDQIVVGFAAETEDLFNNAKKKISQKNLDLIVANDVSNKEIGFESDINQVFIIDRNGKSESISKMPKSEIAKKILDRIELLLTT